MGKNIIKFICSVILSLSFVIALAQQQDDKQGFKLVNWNVLKTMYKANSFMYENKKTAHELIKNPVFKSIITAVSTPDSYASLLDQNTTFYIHPKHELLGAKLTELKNAGALHIIKKAIDSNQCTRGFYTWTDHQEKYMVVCPLVGATTDDHKLYYAYTMYVHSMPDYYKKTLKNSTLE